MTFSSAAAGGRTSGTRRSLKLQLTPKLTLLAVVGLLALLTGCGSPESYPQTALFPLSDFARIGDAVQTQTFYWAVGVFVLVEGALLYVMFRFRGKPDDAEPKQVHGNTIIEIVWTLIPALILAFIAVPTVQGIFKTNETPGKDALTVEVIAHQWWWEFRYPEYDLVTANQLYIPVGRTVSFKQSSADVIHSFWPPRFSGKRDVFPNRETRLWFKAEKAGEFPGQCTEFCGIQHARMSFRVKAQEPAEFAAWVKEMRSRGPKPAVAAAPTPTDTAKQDTAARTRASATRDSGQVVVATAPVDSLYAAGEKLFMTKGCSGCHSLQAYQAPKGMVGPNLANVGARTWIAAGTLRNTDQHLAKWIRDPQEVKVGVAMPDLNVTESEARALVAFLRAHN